MINDLKNKRILITGGLGMIGSTIAHKLAHEGAVVTIVDSCLAPYGANIFNIHGIKDLVEVSNCDIRDKEAMKSLVKDKDAIFNLAGQVSHNDSMNDPFLDADINYLGHLNVLECVRKYNPKAVILYSGSRLQFGEIKENPVKEDHPLEPKTPYALNKTAAENMYKFYFNVHKINCVLFRIANPYGPRSQMKHNKYSLINWFIRQAMENKTIKVFGSGDQVRDYIYVEDLANAFVMASMNPKCYGETFNIGSGKGTKFKDMVEAIISIVGTGRSESVPWPENYINVETGDYITDVGKFSKATGWRASVDLIDGIKKTYSYYLKNKSHYW